jgi:hypothetical protein
MRSALVAFAIAFANCHGGLPTTPDMSPVPDMNVAPLPAMRHIGVAMPDLLRAYLGDSATKPADARKQMMLARARGFTYARIEGSAFWPSEMTGANGWIADPDAYFTAFDALVADARAAGLRLVPILLFNNYLFPDVAGEPRSKLFIPGSISRVLAERYISDVVKRYASNDVIQFWDIGEEFNLYADLDNTGCTRSEDCSLAPAMGTPSQRSAADNFFSCNACRGVSTEQEDLAQFFGAIATLIHSIDPAHKVSSGLSFPRANAYHLAYSPCPTCDDTADTAAQYESVLTRLHPAGVDIVSVHPFLDAQLARFGDWDVHGRPLLARTATLVAAMGKELYVGEYGEQIAGSTTCGSTACGGDPDKLFTTHVLDALTANEVPYSAVWAFEWHPFCVDAPDCWTVAADAPIVDSMMAHESAYGSCSGKVDGVACPVGVCLAQRCVAPGPAAPTTLAQWTFQSSTDIAAWNPFTICSGCAPGSFSVVGSGTSSYAELTSYDLTCTGTCTPPGATYAESPAVAVAAGGKYVTLRASARASAENASLRLIAEDASHNSLAQQAVAVDQGTTFATTGVTMPLPPSTADVRVRFDLFSPSATIDVATIEIDSTP